jgi:hypothetical protein
LGLANGKIYNLNLKIVFMRASIFGTGLNVFLLKEDKSKEKLECIVENFENMKVFLNIVDIVKEKGNKEEPGFHIRCIPDGIALRESSEIHISLSKERWNNLTTKYDPEAMGGYFESRCRYDRCSFNYWDENLIPKA